MDRSSGAAAAFAAGLALLAAVPAHAQFRMEFGTASYCDRLQAQYMSALRASGGSTGPSGASMVQQDQLRSQLGAMQLTAQRNNCNGGFFLGPGPSRACPAINAEIQRISRQLAQVRGSGFGFMGFYSPQQEAERLRDVLQNSGCDIPLGGTTRTLCVRTCDGYYFPINAQANSTRFQTDAVTCQAMYAEPGQAELFVQPAGAEIEDATAVASGRRYGDMPNALLYRETFVPACQVQLTTGIRSMVVRYLSLLPKKKAAIVAALRKKVPPLPQTRPPASEDPETLANLAGGFGIAPVIDEAAPLVASLPPKAVRLVGDAYYADLFDLARVRQEQQLRPSISLVGSANAAEAPPPAAPAQVPPQGVAR